jgi:molecular chaperone HtpG
MMSDEKFYERAEKFSLFKNVDSKYFTFEEYEKLVNENQTDKNKSVIYLYTTDKEEQYAYIEQAKNKGYDVLLFDGQLDLHFINLLEQKFKSTSFKRVDAETIDKLIEKEDQKKVELSESEQSDLRHILFGVLPNKEEFLISYESLSENDLPILITRSEYMRRMKEMSQFSPKGMYGSLPDMYSLVVNTSHPIIHKILKKKKTQLGEELKQLDLQLEPIEKELTTLKEEQKKKKEEEINTTDKELVKDKETNIETLKKQRKELLEKFGDTSKTVHQLIDIALLSHNLLKGEAFSRFIHRSVEIIK